VKKPFQQKDLEGKVSRVEASIPSLSLFQEVPAGYEIGQMFHVVFLRDSQWRHVGKYRGATVVRLSHLVTECFKVGILLPNNNRLGYFLRGK
jgi:hypothetical protein